MIMKIRNNDLSSRSIDIDISDSVSIHLYKEEYYELIRLLLPSMEQEIKDAYVIQEKAMAWRKECCNFLKEVREHFYDCSDGECCLRKELNEVNEDKLFETLDKFSKLLGFAN